LGNNGMLTFKADTVDIPVEKQWKDLNGQLLSDDAIASMEAVTVQLYRIEEATVDNTPVYTATPITDQVITLSKDNNWTAVFTDLPDLSLQTTAEKKVYYAVGEAVPNGYLPAYTVNNDTFGDVISVSLNGGASANVFRVKAYGTGCYAPNGSLTCTITEEGHEHSTHVLVTVTNTPSVELPNTGGSGTAIYYALGILLCSLSCAVYISLQSKKIYKERG